MTQPPHYQPPIMPGPGYEPKPPTDTSWIQTGTPTAPPPAPKSRGPLLWIVGAVGVLLLASVAAGIGYAAKGGGDKPAAVSSAAPLPQDRCGGGICQTEPVAEATTPPDAIYTPKAKDFELTAKITSRHCFGSAGCNVEFEPDLAYQGSTLDEDVTWRLTYEATGIEDGPLIGTVEVTGKNYESESELVETKSSKSKITLKITSVEKTGI